MPETQSEDSKRVAEKLHAAGHDVASVWDYVNGVKLPVGAVAPLLSMLPQLSDNRTKEGIVRALGDKVVRGTEAFNVLANVYVDSDDDSLKWATGNTLGIIASKNDLSKLLELAADDTHGRAREMLLVALGRFPDARCEDVLIRAAQDENVAGHALRALGKLRVARALPVIEPYLQHSNRFFRHAAMTAARRIRGES